MTHRNARVALGLSVLLALALAIAGIVAVGSTARCSVLVTCST